MSNDLEQWYSDLNKLLKDICSFLSEECQQKKLSTQARKQANALIQRSKVQLQDMEKIVPRPAENDEAYVDMQNKKEVPVPVVIEQPLLNEPIVKSPYADLPAGFLTNDSKKGYLLWKTRFLLHFDKVKNIFAGIHFDWLLLYGSNRDSKPFCTLDLRCCTAKNLHSDRNTRFEFELIHTGTKKKSYNFIAQTLKDLLQWVEKVNRMKETPSIILPDLASEDEEEEETYDTVQTPEAEVTKMDQAGGDDVDENGEPFYDIVMAPPKPENKNRNSKPDKPPPLPPCRKVSAPPSLLSPPREPGTWGKHQKPASPVSLKEVKEKEHETELRSSDTESVIEYADPEADAASISTDNSFSDGEDGENDYYIFTPKNPVAVKSNGIKKAPSEESVEYDCVVSVKQGKPNSNSPIKPDTKDDDPDEEIYCVLVT